MSRGSYGTPVVPKQRSRPSPAGIEPRDFTWTRYGRDVTTTIDPRDYALPRLAAQVADKWLEVSTEAAYLDTGLTTSARVFLAHVCRQPRDAGSDASSFGLGDLRRRHLDAWEMDLLRQHHKRRSDTAYRKAVYVLALLRRIEADSPGTLQSDVVHRLQSHTRLHHVRNDGVPAFTPEEVRAMRGHAHRLVHSAITRDDPYPRTEVLVALHVLLSLATGEPPEVLRPLVLDDISATTSPDYDAAVARMTHADRLTWLAQRDLVEEYAVTYNKNRAAESYQEVYRRRDHAPHRALTRSLQLTAELRRPSGLPNLWITRAAAGNQPTAATWDSPSYSLRGWLRRAGLDVTKPYLFSRFRKVVTAREALANPARYLSSGRRHTAKTFFGHYTQSSVLRAEAGRILLDAVDAQFEAAVHGLTVVTPEAEALLRQGYDAPGLDADTAKALLAGDLDGPHTACRDPHKSPYEEPGITCGRSATGTCFGCGNALITRQHLPAVLLIAALADPARATDPEVWQRHWKPIHDAITQVILPAFPSQEVERASKRVLLVPLDLGTRNDMRGTDAEE